MLDIVSRVSHRYCVCKVVSEYTHYVGMLMICLFTLFHRRVPAYSLLTAMEPKLKKNFAQAPSCYITF
jgi:hypothetical protein